MEEEQQELDLVMKSCDCQPKIEHHHAYDCPVIVGLIAVAKKKKPRIVAAQKARWAAHSCPTCGKLIGQHTYEETLECAGSCCARFTGSGCSFLECADVKLR